MCAQRRGKTTRMDRRITLICKTCGRDQVVAVTGSVVGPIRKCASCGGGDFRGLVDEPTPYRLTVNDRRFLRSLRIGSEADDRD